LSSSFDIKVSHCSIEPYIVSLSEFLNVRSIPIERCKIKREYQVRLAPIK